MADGAPRPVSATTPRWVRTPPRMRGTSCCHSQRQQTPSRGEPGSLWPQPAMRCTFELLGALAFAFPANGPANSKRRHITGVSSAQNTNDEDNRITFFFFVLCSWTFSFVHVFLLFVHTLSYLYTCFCWWYRHFCYSYTIFVIRTHLFCRLDTYFVAIWTHRFCYLDTCVCYLGAYLCLFVQIFFVIWTHFL